MPVNDVFGRVMVDHSFEGTTRVWWTLNPYRCVPGPHTFQLQVSLAGVNDAAWVDAGPAILNAGVLTDSERRLAGGKAMKMNYRVKMETPGGDFYSKAEPALGRLAPQEWLLAREVVRRENLRFNMIHATEGWLYKRKWEGTVPATGTADSATDFLTGGIITSTNPNTVGTEFEGGYYSPVYFRVDFQPAGTYPQADDQLARGPVDDEGLIHWGRVINQPLIYHGDVYVAAGSDERFYIHPVKHLVTVGRIPMVSMVQFRLAEPTDVIYSLTPPQIDPGPGGAYCG